MEKRENADSLQALERILAVLRFYATPDHPLTVKEILQNIERIPTVPEKPPMKRLPSYATIANLLRRVTDAQIDLFPYTLKCMARISNSEGKAEYIPYYEELYDKLDDEAMDKNNHTRYYYLEPVLTRGECHMLADLVRSSPFISESRTQALISHLDRLYPKVSRHIPLSHYRFKRNYSERMARIAGILDQAIADRKMVRLLLGSYQLVGHGGTVKPEPQNRKLARYLDMAPYALIWSGGNYYLLGRGYGIINLRVDLIMDAIPLSKHFDFPSDFDPHLRRDSSLMRPGQPIHVRLRCQDREGLLADLMDAFGSLPRYTNLNADGTFEVTLSATSAGVKAFSLAHLDSVEVLEPASLRRDLLDTLRLGAEKYATDGERS